jgi:hypothetical protein
MMEILHEKSLSLSRKKTRMGCIDRGFHFILGVDYLPTQTEDNIKVTRAIASSEATQPNTVHYLSERGRVSRGIPSNI